VAVTPPDPERHEVIATFGEAKLVRRSDGKYQLIGGSLRDRDAAKAWVVLFLPHERVSDEKTPPPPGASI